MIAELVAAMLESKCSPDLIIQAVEAIEYYALALAKPRTASDVKRARDRARKARKRNGGVELPADNQEKSGADQRLSGLAFLLEKPAPKPRKRVLKGTRRPWAMSRSAPQPSRNAVGRPWPTGWDCGERELGIALECGLMTARAYSEFDTFRDYVNARRIEYPDWEAAWAEWCANAAGGRVPVPLPPSVEAEADPF